MSDTFFPDDSPFDRVHSVDDHLFDDVDLPDEEAIYTMLENNKAVFAYGAGTDKKIVEEQALLLVMQKDARFLAAPTSGHSDEGIAMPMPEDSGKPVYLGKARHDLPIAEARERTGYIDKACEKSWWGLSETRPNDVYMPD